MTVKSISFKFPDMETLCKGNFAYETELYASNTVSLVILLLKDFKLRTK